jgi:hypothetical protein
MHRQMRLYTTMPAKQRKGKLVVTTIEFWYSIPTIIILIGIQSGHNYCRNIVVPIYLRLMRVNAQIQSEYKPKAPIVKLIMTSRMTSFQSWSGITVRTTVRMLSTTAFQQK